MYYRVESFFWRREIGDKLDYVLEGNNILDALVNTNKDFKHPHPIRAREMAFSHFQSIVDVLYEGLGKTYINDAQARIDLQKYFDSGNAIEYIKDDPSKSFKITDDIFCGINIFFIKEKASKKKQKEEKFCIHGLRYLSYQNRLDTDIIVCLKNLFDEYNLYDKNDYTTGDSTVLKVFEQIGGDTEFYLETPFDWDQFLIDFEGINLLKECSTY